MTTVCKPWAVKIIADVKEKIALDERKRIITERKELADRLISEILAEEQGKK